MKDTQESIYRNKIITIMRNVPAQKILDTAQALYEGGIKLVEITLCHKDTSNLTNSLKAIQMLSKEFERKMIIGAGTVLTPKEAEASIDAGAKYILSPHFSSEIVHTTLKRNAVSIPGAFTPTEIVSSYQAGAHFVKLFPAVNLDKSYIKNISAPLADIPLLAVGGISIDNFLDYIKMGAAGVGIGSGIISSKAINTNRFEDIKSLAKKYTKKLEEGI